MEIRANEKLWVEKYRPRKIEDCILPERLKKTLQQFVFKKTIPNLLLTGRAGVGKTTAAKAMCDELGADSLIINASLHGNIDTLRTEVTQFASTMSLMGTGRKYVILDEADYLNPNSTQPSLRNFIETYSKNCGFILTCNYPHRILKELHSRLALIDFNISKEDKPVLQAQFMKRLKEILDSEKVEYQAAVLANFIVKYFPDWRRIINELQKESATGEISTGVLANSMEEDIKKLVVLIRDKKYPEMRKWVAENADHDAVTLMRKLYDQAYEFLTPSTVPLLDRAIGDYQYKHAFAADPEVNFMAFLVQVMVECEFR